MRHFFMGAVLILIMGSKSTSPDYSLILSELETYKTAYEQVNDQNDRLQVRLELLEKSELSFGKVLDTMRVSSPYGIYRQLRLHRGVDLATPTGSLVYAPHDGELSEPRYDSISGWYVHLDHPILPVKSKFMHLNQPCIPGYVEKGQIIGITGNTGHSTGPHLHWEVWIAGGHVNPKLLIDI